jgi:hypothetical protein
VKSIIWLISIMAGGAAIWFGALPIFILVSDLEFSYRTYYCGEVKIHSPEEAIAFAKNLVAKRINNYRDLKEAGVTTPEQYIAQIEQQVPKCCGADFRYQVISQGYAWSVGIYAQSRKYSHIVEFTRCGGVIYNGGISD